MTTNNLLIVEDDGILAANLSFVIMGLGYGVLGPVSTGEEALALLEDQRADLVLMDIELAGALNGIETAAIITSRSDVPIVFLTGFSQEPLLEQAKFTAPYGYLIKPVAERELAATLAISLHRHAIDQQLKQSRMALAESEAKYRRLVEDAPLGIFRTTMDGTSLLANTEMANMLGCASPEEALNTFTDLAHQLYADPGERKNFIDLLQTHGEVRNFEYQGRKKNGEPIWVLMNARLTAASNTPGQDGPVIDGFAQDITWRKAIESQLMAANEVLERKVEQRTLELQEKQKQLLHAEKLSAIGKLAASVAHEFNNPLQGILLILKGLQKRATMAKEDSQLLQAAINEGLRIKKLIASLRDFNRPSPGKKSLIHLEEAIDSVLLLNTYDFKTKGITLTVAHGEHLPQIFAVPDQIKQVLLNLLSNAMDACPPQGCEIDLTTRQEGEYVVLAIKDNGAGIKPDDMEHIFEPFFTTKSQVKGTGLGLAVVHGIIKEHQGMIDITSQPGQGALCTLRLPIDGGHGRRGPEPAERCSPAAERP
ncbi:ATP-binding protein [Desulfobulbus sp.]|uniref:ATP-binding response regulator n=1 Tax=Desulfobulbus sp. TaxID=895 RepID=UPI0027BAE9A7|nr:ATP-binding protein [Desulfobulbus sp.]